MLRKRAEKEGLCNLAEKFKVSPGYLSMVVNGKKGFGKKVLRALNLQREWHYVRA